MVTDNFKVSGLRYGPVLTSGKDNLVSSSPWNKGWGPKMNLFCFVLRGKRYKKDV